MYQVTIRPITKVTDEFFELVKANNCKAYTVKMNESFQELRSDSQEDLDNCLAYLEDAGFILNELETSCGIRFVRTTFRFTPQDVQELSEAIIACGLFNSHLTRINTDEYSITAPTKFAVKNTVAYLFPDMTEKEIEARLDY